MPLPISVQQPTPQRTLTPALLGVMWVALFGFGTFFVNYSTLVPIGERMGLSAVTAGTVLTVMMVAVVAIQPAAPILNNRLGPRLALLTAFGLQAGGNALALFTQFPLVSLTAGSVVLGLGFGILVVVGTAAAPATVSPDRVGRALGFFGAITTSAAAIGAPLGLWLIGFLSPTGFRWLTFGLVLVALPALLAVPYKQPTSTAAQPSQSASAQSPPRFQTGGIVAVLLPVAIVLTVFGLVLAFGPAAQDAEPVVYIATMQVCVILGRFIASATLDRREPVTVMIIGVLISLTGLSFAALLAAGWGLLVAMLVLGFGIGAVQASSLLLSFQYAGTTNRGSVAWNMTFDIGLGFAGLVGGTGFTYLGSHLTYLLCAAALMVTGLFFVYYTFSRRRRR